MVFVLDTNVIISALLFPGSLPSECITKALSLGKVAVSEAIRAEYREVISRSKFDSFVSKEVRLRLFNQFIGSTVEFVVKESISACRDPKDDLFLEAAVSSNADCIITGDVALLDLNPFRRIPILKPVDFLRQFS